MPATRRALRPVAEHPLILGRLLPAPCLRAWRSLQPPARFPERPPRQETSASRLGLRTPVFLRKARRKRFNLTITNATTTIWPSTAVPGIADGGPDNPVELGVKFRSDVSGTIRGIRFYKAAANTGTHVGNLWSSTGSLLATGTFSNETASGWQELVFATPVAITANTVYVASYHANAGHYSINTNYFTSSGIDNAPLHALANGVSGGNGVYRYGASSAFPDQSWNSSNYWVDVVFEPALPPTLNSIAVTPAIPNITTGATQQFTATGTYSDGSTQNHHEPGKLDIVKHVGRDDQLGRTRFRDGSRLDNDYRGALRKNRPYHADRAGCPADDYDKFAAQWSIKYGLFGDPGGKWRHPPL